MKPQSTDRSPADLQQSEEKMAKRKKPKKRSKKNERSEKMRLRERNGNQDEEASRIY